MTPEDILKELHRHRRDAEHRRDQLGSGGESLAHYFDGVVAGIQTAINAVGWVVVVKELQEAKRAKPDCPICNGTGYHEDTGARTHKKGSAGSLATVCKCQRSEPCTKSKS